MSRGEGRKVRSDKKRDVQPTVSKELKDCIYRLSYITDKPVKDIAEQICISGFRRKSVISSLSQNFRREIRVDNTLYLGDVERPTVRKRTRPGHSERITIRFKSDMYERLSVLAYALDCSVARATGLLLDASVREVDFINSFVKGYLTEHVDEKRMEELKKVLRYINSNNPYAEEVSWFVFISYLMSEVKVHAEKVQDTVTNFVVNRWDK